MKDNVINDFTANSAEADGRRMAQIIDFFISIYGCEVTQASITDYINKKKIEEFSELHQKLTGEC